MQPNSAKDSTGLPVIAACLLTLTLTACGGGSGDTATPTNNDNTAALAIEPVVGTWNLPGDWRELENDVAVMHIRTPDSDGVAAAIVYDFDDASTGLGRECYDIDGAEGTVVHSLSSELFLNVGAFPEAVLSINASEELVITYSVGAATTTDRPTRTITATRIDIAEIDITPLCES